MGHDAASQVRDVLAEFHVDDASTGRDETRRSDGWKGGRPAVRQVVERLLERVRQIVDNALHHDPGRRARYGTTGRIEAMASVAAISHPRVLDGYVSDVQVAIDHRVF